MGLASSAESAAPHTVVALHVSLIAISSLMMVARAISRCYIVRKWGIDDTVAVIAWCFVFAQSILELIQTRHGVGKHIQTVPPENLQKFIEILPFATICYSIASGLTRLSILLFLPRIFWGKTFKIATKIIGSVIIVSTILFSFILFFQCSPVRDLWDRKPASKCYSFPQQRIIFVTQSSLGIILDMCMLAMPIYFINVSMKFSARALQPTLIFCTGIFAFITGILRLYYLQRAAVALDPTFYISIVSVWTGLEDNVGLWVACFYAILPFIHNVLYSLGLKSTPFRGSGASGEYMVESGKAGDGIRRSTRPGIQSNISGTHYLKMKSSISDGDDSLHGLEVSKPLAVRAGVKHSDRFLRDDDDDLQSQMTDWVSGFRSGK